LEESFILPLLQLLQDANLPIRLDEGGAAPSDFLGHDAALLFDSVQLDAQGDLASLVVQKAFHSDFADSRGRSIFVFQGVEPTFRRFFAVGQDRIRVERLSQFFAPLVTDLLAKSQQGFQPKFESRHLSTHVGESLARLAFQPFYFISRYFAVARVNSGLRP
jgi:hypothetical protein